MNEYTIKITLQHDYLRIEKDGVVITAPIRTAKLIADMWKISGNSQDDIENYAVRAGKWEKSNPAYDLGVHIRNADMGNIFRYVKKIVERIPESKLEAIQQTKPAD